MDRVFGFAILSLFISLILFVPFIDFLYKINFQRRSQKTKDMFNKRTQFFDKFSAWKVGTPFGGGLLIIAVVTTLTLWAYGLFSIEVKGWELFVLLFSFLGFGALGLYDDFKKIIGENNGLRFRHKLVIQWILALIIGTVLYLNLGYDFLYIHWIGEISLGIIYILFAGFVIVSFVNAVNISDGLDGLTAGLLIISLVAFLALAGNILDTFLSIFIAILLGSVSAFLYFNIYKARLWMGDVGTMSLGAVLAVIGLLTGRPLAVAVIGGVFVIEAGSSLVQILSKRFLGKKLLPIAPAHLFFLKKGWEEPKIVIRAWLAGIMLAVFGIWLALI